MINSNLNVSRHNGNNSTTEFDYSFKIFDEADLQVYVDEVLQTTGYTVDGVGDEGGGTVTFTTAPNSGTSNVVLVRELDLTQTTSYPEGTKFPSATVEEDLDRGCMIDQQLERNSKFAIRVPILDDLDTDDLILPNADGRANMYLAFDNQGLPTVLNAATASGESVTAANSTAARLLSNRFAEVVNVMDWGAVGDNIADDTAAFQAAMAICVASSTLGRRSIFYMPPGRYKITDTITINQSHVKVLGAGPQATQVTFAPTTTNKVLFDFTMDNDGVTLTPEIGVFNGIHGVRIDSTGNTQNGKVAIRIQVQEEFTMSHIRISNFTSTAVDCKGIAHYGWQLNQLQYGHIYADYPLYIGENPSGGTAVLSGVNLDLDGCKFEDLILAADASRPCIFIEDDCFVSNVEFNNIFMVGGTYGFYWNDTLSTGNSYQVKFRNCRVEQRDDKSKFSYYIGRTGSAQVDGIVWDNCYMDSTSHCVYMRKVAKATFNNCVFSPTAQCLIDYEAISQMNVQFQNCQMPTSGKTITSVADNGGGFCRLTISAGHELKVGASSQYVNVQSATGLTTINGHWPATVISTTTVDIPVAYGGGYSASSGSICSWVYMPYFKNILSGSKVLLSPLPNTAWYAYDSQDVNNARLREDGVDVYCVRGKAEDDARVNLNLGSGTTTGFVLVHATAHGATQHAGGTWVIDAATAAYLVADALGVCDDADTDTKLCIYVSSSNVFLRNRLGETVTYMVTARAIGATTLSATNWSANQNFTAPSALDITAPVITDTKSGSESVRVEWVLGPNVTGNGGYLNTANATIGTATASWCGSTGVWVCYGTVYDVNQILDQLQYIPPANLTVTGAADNGGGKVRLTTSAHLWTGGTIRVTVSGIVGTTEANVTNATATYVDSTHLDLGAINFVNPYVSGGTVQYMANAAVQTEVTDQVGQSYNGYKVLTAT